jgi:hypothetical protein
MSATRTPVGRGAQASDSGGPTRPDAVAWLCVAVGTLVAVAAGVGVFVGGGEPSTVTTVHGETVPLFGRGVYRYDSLIVGSGSVGVDVVTLFLVLPLLAWAALAHRRGSVRGTVTLLGVLTYCAYLYTSRAVDTAFNDLFLVYVAAMSVSLFALLWTVRSLPVTVVTEAAGRLPRRSTAGFLLLLPMVLVVVWLPLVVEPLVTRRPAAAVEHYTTFVTGALDLGILLPAALIGAVLVLRRQVTGYVIAFCLTGFTALLGPALVAMTIAQLRAGVEMGAADLVTFVVSFLALSWFAAGVLLTALRRLQAAGGRGGCGGDPRMTAGP